MKENKKSLSNFRVLLEKSFSLLFEQWRIFAFLAFFPYILILVLTLLLNRLIFLDLIPREVPVHNPFVWILIIAVAIFIAFAHLFVQIGTILVLKNKAQEQTVSFVQIFNQSKKYFLPYFLTLALLGLVVGAGMMLMLVPGIIFALWFFLAPYLVVLEDLSPFRAFKRSKELTRDYVFACFLRFLLFFVLIFFVFFILVFSFWLVLTALFGKQKAEFINDFLSQVLTAIIFVLEIIFCVVIYWDLKRIKEEKDSQQEEELLQPLTGP